MDRDRPEQEHPNVQRRATTPFLRRLITEFYRTALDDYERAGYPFGEHADAMLIWFEFGERTTQN